MRVGIYGTFDIKVWRAGKLAEHRRLPNSLTKRGAIELIGRLTLVDPISQDEGSQISDFINIFSTRMNVILESGFVALNRADRIAYYDSLGNEILGDNRGWFDFDLGASNEVFWDELPPLTQPQDGSRQATFTMSVTPGAQTWRGLWIGYERTGGGQRIKAVLASAVLSSALNIQDGDTVDVSWTLKLTPTFA